jgi:hypothetical protein
MGLVLDHTVRASAGWVVSATSIILSTNPSAFNFIDDSNQKDAFALESN